MLNDGECLAGSLPASCTDASCLADNNISTEGGCVLYDNVDIFIRRSNSNQALESSLGLNQIELVISPNPVTNNFRLQSESDIDILRIVDYTGKEIKKIKDVSNNQQVQTAELVPGIYLILAETQGRQLRPVRFIKL